MKSIETCLPGVPIADEGISEDDNRFREFILALQARGHEVGNLIDLWDERSRGR